MSAANPKRNEAISEAAKKKEKSSWITNKCQDLEPCRAWIALLAAFLSNLLLGLSDAFGVYYDALVEKYDAKRADVGWILPIRWIFIFFGGDVYFHGQRIVCFISDFIV